MFKCLAHMYAYGLHICMVPREVRRGCHLELDSQMVVRCHVGAEN